MRRQCSAAAVLAARRSSELKSSSANKNNRSNHSYGTEMLTALRHDMAGKDILVDDKESYVSITPAFLEKRLYFTGNFRK